MESEKEIRARHSAEAGDHTGGDGYQAIVRSTDPDTGEDRAVWIGKASHGNTKDAIATARGWIDAEVGRVQRIEILSGRRRDELPRLLESNLEKIDDLKRQRSDINTQIKNVEDENGVLIRETNHPEVLILMYEGTKSFAYALTEKGDRIEVDDRQMGLFVDGAGDSESSPPNGV